MEEEEEEGGGEKGGKEERRERRGSKSWVYSEKGRVSREKERRRKDTVDLWMWTGNGTLDWDPVLVQQSLMQCLGWSLVLILLPCVHTAALDALTPSKIESTALSRLPRPLTAAGQVHQSLPHPNLGISQQPVR